MSKATTFSRFRRPLAVLALAALVCPSLAAGEWHLRIKPMVGYRTMDATGLKDDFDQSRDHWLAFLQQPLGQQERYGQAATFAGEVSFPIQPSLSAFGRITYFADSAYASDTSSGYSANPYTIRTNFRSSFYTAGLLAGINLYKYLGNVPNTAVYLSLAGGMNLMHLKRAETYVFNYTPGEYIAWGGTYSDLGYCGEITLGFERNLGRWGFFFGEAGYSALLFGKLKGDERWEGSDAVTGYSNPTFSHAPPANATFVPPYDGVLEVTDTQANLPDQTALTVNLSGLVIYFGLGIYLF